MSIEANLCDLMQYDDAILFPRARDALAAWCEITGHKIDIPTNCCSALLPFANKLIPIDPETGLAPIPVQLYGYRQEFPRAEIEIDPLMTGILGRPFADSTIISFGYSKTIDIGGGGAILTHDRSLADELKRVAFFPKVLRAPLAAALHNIHSTIMEKKRAYEETEKFWFPLVKRLSGRPTIPWRFMGKRTNARYENLEFKFSCNYPALPGVTDPAAIQFGKEVINIWR